MDRCAHTIAECRPRSVTLYRGGCRRHKHHMCFAFHSRLHFEIFDYFYPAAFQNWWSDTWSSLVYGPAATFWLKVYPSAVL